MYHYSISGLHFDSNVPFSLTEAEAKGSGVADVIFTLKDTNCNWDSKRSGAVRVGDIHNGAGYPSISVWQNNEKYLLDCHNSHKRIRFARPRDGQWIRCDAEPGTRTHRRVSQDL